ncbi:MAG: hypothetical protein FJ284_08600 [Planctomycetes bacterium]|nr:hypothetical protein [Planctomycetota bacterium]
MPERLDGRFDLGLPHGIAVRLRRLRTPERIQDFVNAIPWNTAAAGQTARSVVGVLEHDVANCIEAAFVAAAALALAGHPPLLMDIAAARGDVDHVVTLFRRRGLWGAISKSNSPLLRYRDPIHRSLRELAISYFPQYVKHRRKTLRGYSVPVDLRKHDPPLWATGTGDVCREMVDTLTGARHFAIMPAAAAGDLRPIDEIEHRSSLMHDQP